MKQKILCAAALFVVLFTALPQSAGAMVEPPSLTIIINNAPDSCSVTLQRGTGSEVLAAGQVTRGWETCYTFYDFSVAEDGESTLVVDTGTQRFQYPVSQLPELGYTTVYTVNLRGGGIVAGTVKTRGATIFLLRTTLAIALGAVLFALFGYRGKRAWLTFAVMNLLVQGGLNLWLLGYSRPGQSPLTAVLLLLLCWLPIVAGEAIALCWRLPQYRRRRHVLYSLAANTAGFILGAALLLYLPF